MAYRIAACLCILFLWSISFANAQGRYYKMETHCHSNNSGDGYIAPADLLQQYKDRGYEIVFMSDHETLTDAETLNEQNERRAVNKKSFTSDLKNNFADSPHKQLTASEQN